MLAEEAEAFLKSQSESNGTLQVLLTAHYYEDDLGRWEFVLNPPGQVGDQGTLIDELANLQADTILDEHRLASILGVAPKTVKRMVHRGELPAGVVLGKRTVWFAGRVLGHIHDRAERAEQDAEKERKRLRGLQEVT